MKTTATIFLLFIASFTLFSCKKDYSGIVNVSGADSAKTITVQKGKTIYVTLEFGNSPYYVPGVWEIDKSILNLAYQGHKDPTAGQTGSAGTFIWTFSTLKTGTTAITLKNDGFGGDYKTLFTTIIKVE